MAEADQAVATLRIVRKRSLSSGGDPTLFEQGDRQPLSRTTIADYCSCDTLSYASVSTRYNLPLTSSPDSRTSPRSHQFLCKSCSDREAMDAGHSNQVNTFETKADLHPRSSQNDPVREMTFSFIDPKEQPASAHKLVWKLDAANDHPQQAPITPVPFDSGSLSAGERRSLVQQALQNLQAILDTGPTSTTTDNRDLDRTEWTRRALRTTIDFLSSSLDIAS